MTEKTNLEKLEKLSEQAADLLTVDTGIQEAADLDIPFSRGSILSFFKRSSPVIVFGLSAIGLTVYLTKRYYEKLYADLAEQEIADAKAYYDAKARPKPSPTELAEQGGYATEPPPSLGDTLVKDREQARLTYDYRSHSSGPDEEDFKKKLASKTDHNIFHDDTPLPIWDYKAELERRSEGGTYIISQAEFLENDIENTQTSLTYYEGDAVLADERDGVLNNEEELLGENNIQFGYGSNDRNVVFVRNERLATDFEVLRSRGKYAKEVLGFDDEETLQHSDDRRHRRLRDD